MSNAITLAERLAKAGNSAAQSWVITELLLNAYPATIRQSVIAAAVPHWFTAEILAALLDLSMEEANERYAALQQLSIVQPFGDLGHTLHDLTRNGILTYLASHAIEELRQYSQRVQDYLSRQNFATNSQTEVESIYYQLLLTVDKGRATLKTHARTYRNNGNFAAIENLLRNCELIDLGLLESVDQIELERQEYWTAEALANRGKAEKDEQGTQYLRKALEQFAPPEQLPVLLANEPEKWREQIDTYKRDFVLSRLESVRSAGDLARQSLWMAELGDIYRDQGDLEASLQQLEQALAMTPNDARTWGYRGETYRLLKRYAEALADFDRAIALDEKYAWAIASRGQVYQALKRYEEALADFDRAIQLDDTMAQALASRGETYRLMKRYEEALADFDRAIKLDEKYTWAIASRGQVYQALKRYNEALIDFDHIIELNAKDTWVINRRGDTYRKMERYDKALENYTQTITLDEKNTWAFAFRGETYRLMRRQEEALSDFNSAVKLDDKDAWTIKSRGQVYQALKRYNEALSDFNCAIELDENDAWTIDSRGLVYLLLRFYKEAHTDFDRAISIEENDWGFYCRGLSYFVQKQLTEAQSDLTRAIDLAKLNYVKEPHDWQNTLNLMLYHLVASDNSMAERFLQEAFDGNAPIPRLKAAIQDLEELLMVLPDHAQARIFLQRIEAHLAGLG